MITITITKQEIINKLAIETDCDTDNPREWSNLGYFITIDRGILSPDDNETLENIIRETGNEATSQEEHIKMIKNRIESETDEKVLAIYPVVKYRHSETIYKLGTIHGFDYSNNGFYIITDKTQKKIGTSPEDFEKVIKEELESYNSWVNGEVYSYILYNEEGEIEDSCGGFYGIEGIRENLPTEFENEDLSDYLIN